jgi:polyribonucleotide nucleotidyltransferase
MNNESIQKLITVPYGEGELTINYDTRADQAHGSVMISHAGTTVMAVATFGDEPVEGDFVPLRVDYLERFYAIQQILGPRYTRREGKPSDEATVTARLIDRALRPHLSQSLRHPLHVVVTVLSLGSVDPDTLSIIGASLAIQQSGLTWSGPVMASRVFVGKTGNVVVNQPIQDAVGSIVIAGIADVVNMVEGEGDEITEELVSDACLAGIKTNTEIINNLSRSNEPPVSNQVQAINNLVAETSLTPNEAADKLATGYRTDGRSAGQVRDLDIVINPINGAHASARFSRGNTTVLSIATLGSLAQSLFDESIESVARDSQNNSFMHHYNFPPYAGGQAGYIGSVNRREVGHGHLAQTALLPLLPTNVSYPYSIRVVSEVISADGSSSMAAVCGSSLALHTAGVPIKNLCAGVAIGLTGDSADKPIILTDIDAHEDRHGQMDFKIAGTTTGITAMQLDTKNTGINLKTFNESLQAGRRGRSEILEAMNQAIENISAKHPDNAPLIIQVPREHIGRIIGKGGENIKTIESRTGTKVDIKSEGYAVISGTDTAKQQVIQMIQAETRTYHPGEDFQATVREFLPYGAIVELDAGREALLHVSELRDQFVERTEDLLKIKDVVPVTIVETSSDGRIKVSIREKHPDFFNETTAVNSNTD